MAKVLLAITMSLDGYIAGPNDGAELPLGEGGEPLFEWFFTGDTPSKHYEVFRLSKPSAEFFDAGIDTCGAVISGRRTYDIAGAWDGNGPVPGLPLFVLTHNVPAKVPETTVPYTFVTDGIGSAIRQADAAAGDKYVALTGSQAARSTPLLESRRGPHGRWPPDPVAVRRLSRSAVCASRPSSRPR